MDNTVNRDARIALLTELHRPLEDHWRNSKECDAQGSDHLYKHHVTRLKDIYTNHEFKVGSPKEMANMSPMTQLFGISGLLGDMTLQKKSQRESGWKTPFITAEEYMDDKKYTPNSIRRPIHESPTGRSMSPDGWNQQVTRGRERVRPSSARSHGRPDSASSNRPRSASRPTSASRPISASRSNKVSLEKTNQRYSCNKRNMPAEDITIIGLYKLDDRQLEIYKQFTEMLSTFDDFDMKNILQDAQNDASAMSLLTNYSGTS